MSSSSLDGAPTVSAAIGLLYETVVQLSGSLDRVRDDTDKLANPTSLGAEEIENVSWLSIVSL